MSTARSVCGRRRALAAQHQVDGRRARRLLGDRRAQVAERALRLRRRLLPAPGGPPRTAMAVAASYLQRADGREPVRLGAGVVPPRTRHSPSGRRCARWAARRRGIGRPLLRARRAHSPTVLGAEAGVEILNEVVLNQVLVRFATTTRRRERWSGACRRTAPAGSAGPTGRAARRCGSRFRASGRRRRTSSGRRRPS